MQKEAEKVKTLYPPVFTTFTLAEIGLRKKNKA